MTEFPVIALRSVELGTPDLASSVDFYTRVWGLDVVAEVEGKVFLAATGADFHVLELKQSNRSELRKISFRVGSAEALASLFARTVTAGCAVLRDIGPADGPAGGERFVIREPQGAVLNSCTATAASMAAWFPTGRNVWRMSTLTALISRRFRTSIVMSSASA